MISGISSVQSSSGLNAYAQTSKTQSGKTPEQAAASVRDKLDLGQSGPISTKKAISMVTERAMAKLRSVVSDARAELGLGENDPLDTSAEATAQRIGDFALNFFEKYMEKHPEVSGEDARKQFADFIGDAIGKGIEEARGILQALSAMNPEIGQKVDTIANLVQKRLDEFVAGKDKPAL